MLLLCVIIGGTTGCAGYAWAYSNAKKKLPQEFLKAPQ